MITYYLFQWLSPAVHLLGLIIGIWAFRKCHKKGYIVISVYFGLALFSLIAMPKINRMLAKQNSVQISAEAQEKLSQEINEVYQRYYEETEGASAQPMTLNLKFPLGPIILVSGLWILARKEQVSEPEGGLYGENAGR